MSVWFLIGCIYGFLGVALGAFGAHALSAQLTGRSLEIYHTATLYQFVHALALIGVALWSAQRPGTAVNVAGACFASGIFLFSGSLYALALSGVRVLGAITPLGGVLFLLGWVALGISAWK